MTAGNSSQTSDGAAATILMDAARAQELGIQPLARLVAYAVAGCLPEEMGMGPLYAVPKALKKAGLTLNDIGLIEFNEAFAAQALAVMRELGFDPEKVNVNGGAIALGHPLGCTGAKLTATLLSEMKRRKVRYGMVTMCVGGGQGAAGIFERLSETGAEDTTGQQKRNGRDCSRPHLLIWPLSAPPDRGHPTKNLCFCRRKSLQPGIQAALVAGNGVRMQNALLDALVEGGNGLAELCLGSLDIALGDGFAQGAEAGAHAGAVDAVYHGAGLGLAGALQRRYMVCHYASLI